ncbi:MAG: adenylate kinase [Calditrichaceae bacterium]|nr:adenylate kinase [Calditrichaceae bacterium]MBN2708060.1 adenylate kinase [Calditrichaceae bacterium]RQV92301.1 MAG: adenylate kinase [Calditrichota bacterium]
MYLILFGAPGVGKGTQAKLISENFNIPQISTGDMLRAAIKEGSDLGKKAEQFIKNGELVPDNIILSLIEDRIIKPDCRNGLILDGFPRTISQADSLKEIMIRHKLPSFICIEITVEEEEILKRILGRKTCSKCGADYNDFTNPAPDNMICPKCGGQITSRADDNEETVKNRLRVYNEKTAVVKNYYQKDGKFYSVNGNDTVEGVYKNLEMILNKQE